MTHRGHYGILILTNDNYPFPLSTLSCVMPRPNDDIVVGQKIREKKPLHRHEKDLVG